MHKETQRKAEREAAKRLRAMERERQRAVDAAGAGMPMRAPPLPPTRDQGRREGPGGQLR
jgi:hypothetical protein